MKKLLSLILVFVMLFTVGAAFAEAKPAASPTVYKVEDQNGNTIYLFGTMHLMKMDVYESAQPFGAALEEAYAYADKIAVEIDVVAALNDPAAQMAAALDMMYTDGTTVLDHGVTEEMLYAISELLGVPAETLAAIKLSSWSSLLLLPAMAELNMSVEGGVDLWVLQRAYSDGKEVVELETIDSQTDVIASMSDELMVYQIEMLLEDPAETVKQLSDMYDAWLGGDIENLKKLLDESENPEGMDEKLAEDLRAFNEALGKERDNAFFEDAVNYLASGEKVMIAIGAAHIVGETGIASRLAEAGYTVTDISR